MLIIGGEDLSNTLAISHCKKGKKGDYMGTRACSNIMLTS